MSAQIAELEMKNTAQATKVVGNSKADSLREEENNTYYEVDVLSQFRANLNQLEELNSRLHFMMNEVAGLVKRK